MADVRMGCPICHSMIPVSTDMIVTEEDVQIAFMPGPMENHIRMHKGCICEYVQPSGDRVLDHTCTAHGG